MPEFRPSGRALAMCAAASLLLASSAYADVVTGTVSPQGASVVIVDSSGKTVAKLPAGPYQLQLPVGKYIARCQAPKQRDQQFLSLSDPVTVDINCG
jgi:hypothetical protein